MVVASIISPKNSHNTPQKEVIPLEKKMLINGMMCNHCKMTVEKALKAVPGVADAQVDLDAKTATIALNGDVSDEALMAAVKAKDFTPVKML